MRKLIIISLLSTMLLAACGNSASAVSKQSEPEEETPIIVEPPASEPASLALAPASPDTVEAEPVEESSIEAEPAEESPSEEPAEEDIFDPASVNPDDFYSADGSEFDFDAYLLALGYTFMDFPKWESRQSGYIYNKSGQQMRFIYSVSGFAGYYQRDGLYYSVYIKATHAGDDNGGPLVKTRQISSHIGDDVTEAAIVVAKIFAQNDASQIDPRNLPIQIHYGGAVYDAPFEFTGELSVAPEVEHHIDDYHIE